MCPRYINNQQNELNTETLEKIINKRTKSTLKMKDCLNEIVRTSTQKKENGHPRRSNEQYRIKETIIINSIKN